MNRRVLEALASGVAEVALDAEIGHCLRIDDMQSDDATSLAGLLAGQVDIDHVRVAVLDRHDEGRDRVSVESAVGIRNDKDRVFVLLVPSGLAHVASSLDNSFERLTLVARLDEVASQLEVQLDERFQDLPVRLLRRTVSGRTSLEAWLDFLCAVLDSEDENPFPRELWRVGLLVDEAEGAELRVRIGRNNSLVTAIADPPRVTATVRERLRLAGVAPGEVFETLVQALNPSQGSLRDTIGWARRIHDDYGITFGDIPFDVTTDSDLESLEMQSFRKADGTLETFCKLRETDEDGALFCQTSEDNPGIVGLRWKTKPARPTDVAKWLLELIPPPDLRDADTLPLVDMKVAGSRSSAQLKLNVGADDLTGNSLFIVRVTALDATDTPILLSDGTPAESESDQFEVLIEEAPAERGTRHTSASSLADAQLRAVLSGAPSIDVDMQAWDLSGQVFGVRVGKHLSSQIRIASVVITMQRRLLDDPRIVAFEAKSQYGEPIDPATVSDEMPDLPGALGKRRREVFAMLKEASPQDVPEVFNWTDEGRHVASEYALTYKRALDVADAETRETLLRMDTVSIQVGTSAGVERAVVVLPLHPLRLGWIAAHHGVVASWCEALLERPGVKSRRLVVDQDLVGRVQPSNLPFASVDASGSSFVYFDELAFGSGVLLEPGLPNPEATAAAVYSAFGVPRESSAIVAAADMVTSRIDDFRRSHPEASSLRVAAVNPGDGEILGRAVESVVAVKPGDDELASIAPPRVDVVAYGRHAGFASPLPRLGQLQAQLQLAQVPGRQSHLAPPLGLAVREPEALIADDRSSHLALVQDIATQGLDAALESSSARFTAFEDLLTPMITARVEDDGKPRWLTSPALTSKADSAARSVVEAHRTHQLAVGARLGLDGAPALVVALEPDGLQAIRVLHELSDWVMTLDRYVGLDLYEDPLSIGLGNTSFILDYAPDFIEGLSHRLTVTTQHRAEVSRILERAMDDLGLDAVDQSVTPILENLLAISGRLVLRLQGSDSFARETVSLAAVISHLRRRGNLDDIIIVPVDSHDEIFGRAAREPGLAARRCDLLLVKVQRNGLRIECVEVKSRKAAAVPLQLADDIVDQLEMTRRLLISRFFATDPARVDAPLQRARLAGMLHYYADRAAVSGTISAEKLDDVHKNIDRHLESNTVAEISMRGFVISLAGAAGFPTQHRQVPITVLTAADLGEAGFSTKFDQSRLDLMESGDSPDEGSSGGQPEVGSGESGGSPVSTPHDHEADQGSESPRIADRPESETDEGDDTAVSAERKVASQARSDDEPQSSIHQEHSGRPTDVAVALGTDAHGADVVWSISTRGSPHAFLLGIPGQGKSVTTRRIVRIFADSGLPSLLFDFHGDMAASPPAGAQVLDASDGLPFSPFEEVAGGPPIINAAAFETAEIIAYVAGLGEIQRAHVYKALQNAYNEVLDGSDIPAAPTLASFAEHLEAVESEARGKHARERVRQLTDFGLFTDSGAGSFDPRAGGMVIDVSKIQLDQVQLAAGAFLLRKIYREMFLWPQDSTLKLAIVLDEAHRLAKDVTLPKLMKEGRKYGVVVVVASQGTADFHRDVLGNAGAKVVFRTNFPASKQVAGYLRGRTGQDLSQEVEKLGVGQAYVSTPDMPQARKVFMAE